MSPIDPRLRIHDVVDGRDDPMPYAQPLMHNLHHRRQAIRCAGSRRQQIVPGRIVEMVIDAHDDVECKIFLDRRGNDHLLHTAIIIGLQRVFRLELAGTFKDQINAMFAPRDRAGRLMI